MDKVLIHRYAKFQKTLETLRRGDRRGARAAKRAEDLIKEVASGDLSSLAGMEKRTKHGELRISNCIKYDLGGGYRLVSVKYKDYMIFTFLGSHDECNRWIENNRRFEPEISSECKEVDGFFGLAVLSEECPSENEGLEKSDYDEILMEKVDDKLLKHIFKGLCKE